MLAGYLGKSGVQTRLLPAPPYPTPTRPNRTRTLAAAARQGRIPVATEPTAWAGSHAISTLAARSRSREEARG